MYMLDANKQRVQLTRLDTDVVNDAVTRAVVVRSGVSRRHDTFNASALIARASWAFFGIGQSARAAAGETTRAVAPTGPPPVAFRESRTGLLHVAYREVVIRFRHGVPERTRQTILRKHGFEVRERNAFVPDQFIVHDQAERHTGEQLVEVANDWAEMDEVAFAAPNFVSQFRRHAPPNIRAEEWHLRAPGSGAGSGEGVSIRDAWKITRGKSSVVVAVLDDGVDVDHPNLKSQIRRNPSASSPDKVGRDFFLPNDHPDHYNPRPKLFRDPFDRMPGNDIHGTPCAGVIAAAGRNDGSVGAAPGCRILPVKVFHADDLASTARVADAIRYAATNADILSCSWTGGEHPNIQEALRDAGMARGGKGAAIFCATGNDDADPVGFPASDASAIGVGACTDAARIASYSNVGPEVAFVAPSNGGARAIFTTDVSVEIRGFNLGTAAAGGADGLHTNSFGGTSSATPLAAGVAALMLSVNPNLSRDEVREVLKRTADKIGSGYDANGHSDVFGHGRVNAARAVAEAQGMFKTAKAAERAGAKGAPGAAGAKKAGAKKAGAKKASAKKGGGKKRGGKKSAGARKSR